MSERSRRFQNSEAAAWLSTLSWLARVFCSRQTLVVKRPRRYRRIKRRK